MGAEKLHDNRRWKGSLAKIVYGFREDGDTALSCAGM